MEVQKYMSELEQTLLLFRPVALMDPNTSLDAIAHARYMDTKENYRDYNQRYEKDTPGSTCIEDVDSEMGSNASRILALIEQGHAIYEGAIGDFMYNNWLEILPPDKFGNEHGLFRRIAEHALDIFTHTIEAGAEVNLLQHEFRSTCLRFIEVYRCGGIPIGWEGDLASGVIVCYPGKHLRQAPVKS